MLVLILFCGSLFFLFRQQGNTKMAVASPIRTFGGLRPVLSPTATALFSDNFSDNSQNWDVGVEPKEGSTINNGTLTLMASNNQSFREPLPSNVTYDDASIATTITLLRGDQNDSVGLYFRANESTGQGYSIDIYGNDTFAISKVTVDAAQKTHSTYLAEPQYSSALHTKGQKNDVRVIMKGVNIVLVINDTVVKSVRDGEFTSGEIMLFVENGNSSTGVVASFDAVAVYAAPEHLPN